MIDPQWLAAGLRLSIPILITGIGAVYSERGGVINIGLEGMMIFGTVWGAVGAYFAGPLVGLLAGIAGGAALALIHAVVSVHYGVDQIVSGVAINILAGGGARLVAGVAFDTSTSSPTVSALPAIDIPVLAQIEGWDDFFTGISPVILAGLVIVFITAWVLKHTAFGLRLRSVGENPEAADTLGINVYYYRYMGVLISGALAGLAGGYLSIEHTSQYIEGMTGGMGFIALAAMIFGNWTAVGTMGASLLFGYANALSLSSIQVPVPYQFVEMLPYVLTMLVLAGFVVRAEPPAADGEPYDPADTG